MDDREIRGLAIVKLRRGLGDGDPPFAARLRLN
jgi:hypothetical protein